LVGRTLSISSFRTSSVVTVDISVFKSKSASQGKWSRAVSSKVGEAISVLRAFTVESRRARWSGTVVVGTRISDPTPKRRNLSRMY